VTGSEVQLNSGTYAQSTLSVRMPESSLGSMLIDNVATGISYTFYSEEDGWRIGVFEASKVECDGKIVTFHDIVVLQFEGDGKKVVGGMSAGLGYCDISKTTLADVLAVDDMVFKQSPHMWGNTSKIRKFILAEAE